MGYRQVIVDRPPLALSRGVAKAALVFDQMLSRGVGFRQRGDSQADVEVWVSRLATGGAPTGAVTPPVAIRPGAIIIGCPDIVRFLSGRIRRQGAGSRVLSWSAGDAA